jgi:hypothetical protein
MPLLCNSSTQPLSQAVAAAAAAEASTLCVSLAERHAEERRQRRRHCLRWLAVPAGYCRSPVLAQVFPSTGTLSLQHDQMYLQSSLKLK